MSGLYNGLKNYIKPTDIYKSQRLMLWLMNCAGYLPWHVTEDRNGKRLRPSAIAYIFFIVSFTITIVCLALMAFNGRLITLAVLFDRPPLAQVGEFVKFVSVYTMIPLFYAPSFCKRKAKKMAICLQNIANIDKKLSIIGIDMDYWKGYYVSHFLIAFIVMLFIVILLMSHWQIPVLVAKAAIYRQDPSKNRDGRMNNVTFTLWLTIVTHHLTLLGMTIIICYYANIIIEIRQRFQGLNRMLRCMIEPGSPGQDIDSLESTHWNIRNNAQLYSLVDDLCNIHNDLCDTCSILSDYFSVQMVFVVSTILMTIITNGYFFWLFKSIAGREDKLIEWVYTSIESISVAFAIVLACNTTQSLTEENETCSAYVHRILSSVTAPDTKNKLIEFVLQSNNRKIEFSAFGYFALNRGLLLAMAEAITTYFLLLVEFDRMEQNQIRSREEWESMAMSRS